MDNESILEREITNNTVTLGSLGTTLYGLKIKTRAEARRVGSVEGRLQEQYAQTPRDEFAGGVVQAQSRESLEVRTFRELCELERILLAMHQKTGDEFTALKSQANQILDNLSLNQDDKDNLSREVESCIRGLSNRNKVRTQRKDASPLRRFMDSLGLSKSGRRM